jgi:hypothetical protein
MTSKGLESLDLTTKTLSHALGEKVGRVQTIHVPVHKWTVRFIAAQNSQVTVSWLGVVVPLKD